MKESYLEEHIDEIFTAKKGSDAYNLLREATRNASISRRDSEKILNDLDLINEDDLETVQRFASNLRLKFMGLGTL
jgi:hypothetical protein